jgi:hypothetical protein
MTDFQADFDSLDEIETLVRAAGDYVRASDDLRPRVLEAARVVRTEQRARWRVCQLAACALLLGLFVVAARRHAEMPATRSQSGGPTGRLLSQAPPAAVASESVWEMVDSFTDMRRRQAEVLRLEL